MSKITPKFSVLMPLFYKENYIFLDQSLYSIYTQTLLPDEILLIKEGKLSYELTEVVTKWNLNDKIHLRVIDADSYGVKGLPECLNIGIKESRNEWIARFDSDDYCLENRFDIQMNFIAKTKVDILGCQLDEYDETLTKYISTKKVPLDEKDIIKFSKLRNPFNHQTVIFNKKAALELGGYPNLRSNEDYGLWGQFIVNNKRVMNLPDTLVKARCGDSFINRRRGLKYIKGEISSIIYLYKIGLFRIDTFIIQLLGRGLIRLMPNQFVKYLYKSIRK